MKKHIVFTLISVGTAFIINLALGLINDIWIGASGMWCIALAMTFVTPHLLNND